MVNQQRAQSAGLRCSGERPIASVNGAIDTERARDAGGAGLCLRTARAWPQPMTGLGVLLLVAGVLWALRVRLEALAAEGMRGEGAAGLRRRSSRLAARCCFWC